MSVIGGGSYTRQLIYVIDKGRESTQTGSSAFPIPSRFRGRGRAQVPSLLVDDPLKGGKKGVCLPYTGTSRILRASSTTVTACTSVSIGRLRIRFMKVVQLGRRQLDHAVECMCKVHLSGVAIYGVHFFTSCICLAEDWNK